MTRSLSRRAILLPALTLIVAACGGDVPKVPLSQAQPAVGGNPKDVEAAHALLGPEAKAALDSGNVLFRRKAFTPALAEYRRSADLAPQHTAPLFGIYMVGRATNNPLLADSAMAGIRARNGTMPTTPTGAPHSMTDSALKDLRSKMKKGEKSG